MKLAHRLTPLAALLLLSGTAFAGNGVTVTENPDGSMTITLPKLPAAGPGASLGTPMAYGSSWGTLYAGLGGTDGVGNIRRTDGSMIVGFGLGNADEAVGLDVAISNYSLQTRFGDNGGINLLAHKRVGETSALAFGIESAYLWGPAVAAARNVKATQFVVGSTQFSLPGDALFNPNRLTASLGVGNGHYQSTVFQANTPNVNMNKLGVFGSLGYQFHEQVSLVSSYTGKDVNAGVSFVPLRDVPLTFTLGYVDLLKKNQPKPRFIGTVGISWKF
jgi:hypothetical protein